MTDLAPGGAIPPLTLGLRLGIALEYAEIPVHMMAERMGVNRATITRWTHNEFKRPPAKVVLEAWADACGVDRSWLIDGQGEMPTPPAFPRLVTVSEITTANSAKKTATRRNKAYCSASRPQSVTMDERAA